MPFKLAIALGMLLAGIGSVMFERRTDGSLEDRASIIALTDRFYDALRAGDFATAAACYAPGTFAGSGIQPASALRMATALSGAIPDDLKLEGLEINGDEAIAELVTQRKGIGPVAKELRDVTTNRKQGTWVRTLVFVKHGETWYLSGEDRNTAGVDLKRVYQDLQTIQARQQQEARALQTIPPPQ